MQIPPALFKAQPKDIWIAETQRGKVFGIFFKDPVAGVERSIVVAGNSDLVSMSFLRGARRALIMCHEANVAEPEDFFITPTAFAMAQVDRTVEVSDGMFKETDPA